MVLERRCATRDAHDACHVVQVMCHGFDELFSPADLSIRMQLSAYDLLFCISLSPYSND